MKKWMLLAGLVALVAIVTVPVAFAQEPADGFDLDNSGMGYGPGYADQNGDGVCDNFVNENGDDVCDNAGTGGHGQSRRGGMARGAMGRGVW